MTDERAAIAERAISAHRLFRRFRLPSSISPGERVKAMTARSGGGTFSDIGEPTPLTERFVYNTGETTAIVSPNARRETFSRAIRKTRKPGPHVGTWEHEGKTHFDPAATTSDRGKAIAGAKASKQHAYYDAQAKRDVVICGKGDYRCKMHARGGT